MKSKWIKIGAPAVALIFLVAFGMISCSSDPMSSPDNGSESYTIESATETPLMSTTSNTVPTILKGRLVLSPDTDVCWFLVVTRKEVYELSLAFELKPEMEGKLVQITGSLRLNVIPKCADFPVFKVEKIVLLDRTSKVISTPIQSQDHPSITNLQID